MRSLNMKTNTLTSRWTTRNLLRHCRRQAQTRVYAWTETALFAGGGGGGGHYSQRNIAEDSGLNANEDEVASLPRTGDRTVAGSGGRGVSTVTPIETVGDGEPSESLPNVQVALDALINERMMAEFVQHLMTHTPACPRTCEGCMAKPRNKKQYKDAFKQTQARNTWHDHHGSASC